MSNLYSYSGKRVAVTGGASGVGAALVNLLDELGASEVLILDIQEPKSLSPSHRFLQVNLADQDAVTHAAAEIGAVDVLFNNAAVAGTAPSATVFSLNVLALRALTQLVTAQMTPGSAVVNTASTAGNKFSERKAAIDEVLSIADWDEALAWFDKHESTLGIDPYSFTKETVQLFTLREAVALGGRGLRINSLCPSPIDTPLLKDFQQSWGEKAIDFTANAAGGLVSPGQVAQSLAFLGMDASRRINGVNLLIDGGSTAGFATGTIDLSALRG